jgi:hypothetical protein
MSAVLPDKDNVDKTPLTAQRASGRYLKDSSASNPGCFNSEELLASPRYPLMPIAAPKSNLYGADCASTVEGADTITMASKQANMTERILFIARCYTNGLNV